MSLSELDPYSDAPLPGPAAVAFNYVKGGPMVPPGVSIKDLPTRLRSLNNWYEKVAKSGQTQFFFKDRKEHFIGQERDAIPIEFVELFQFLIYVTSTSLSSVPMLCKSFIYFYS